MVMMMVVTMMVMIQSQRSPSGYQPKQFPKMGTRERLPTEMEGNEKKANFKEIEKAFDFFKWL